MPLPVAVSTFPFLYSHDGLGAIRHLAGRGWRQFEMMIFPPHCWPVEMTAAQIDEWAAFFDGEGLSITSFCYPLVDNNPNSPCRLMRRYTLDRYKEAIDLAAAWKCPYVVVIPGAIGTLINPPIAWMTDWFVQGVQELAGHAKGTGVGLLLENVPFTYLPTADDMARVAGLIGNEVGINFDICNSAYIAEDVPAAIRRLGGLIRNVHISDTGTGEFKHDRLGTGIVEPGPAAVALQEIGYAGLTVLEIIADALQPGADPDGDIAASHDILGQHGWAARPA